MINHTACDHPSTSSARARCRRARANGSTHTERGEVKATPHIVGSDGKPQTPRFKSDECHVCGVEKIEFKGTDQWTGLLVLVGERCAWRVKRSDNFEALP